MDFENLKKSGEKHGKEDEKEKNKKEAVEEKDNSELTAEKTTIEGKEEIADKEDREVETYIEANKEKIKTAAENWIKTQEEKLEKEGSKRIRSLAAISAFTAVSLRIAAAIAHPSFSSMDMTILAFYAGFGAAGGAIAGKIENYLERRKFNKQKREIEETMGKKPETFEDIKSSLDKLKK